VAEDLTFTRFTELLLARTHERERRDGPDIFFPVEELMADLVPYVDSGWLWQSAKYLEDKNLVRASIRFGPTAQVHLTPQGRIFVENEQGSGLISTYRQQDQVVVVVGDGNQVAVGHGQTVWQSGEFSKEEVLELVDEAENRLRGAELPSDERGDALADLQTVKTQLGKKNPDFSAVRSVLSGLRNVNVIADLVERIHGLLT
jgi:hypothetical protein